MKGDGWVVGGAGPGSKGADTDVRSGLEGLTTMDPPVILIWATSLLISSSEPSKGGGGHCAVMWCGVLEVGALLRVLTG